MHPGRLWTNADSSRDLDALLALARVLAFVDRTGSARTRFAHRPVGVSLRRADRYRLASPAALLPLGVPHRHFVGAQDHVVSAEYLGLFVAEAVLRGDNATLVELPGVGHFEVVMPTSVVWPLVRAATLELVLRV